MIRILHIIHELSGGGAAREMLNVARKLDAQYGYEHTVISLKPPGQHGRELARQAGIALLEDPDTAELHACIRAADIVQIEWWNASLITTLLHRQLPDCRLVIRYHVAGDHAPHIITRDHLRLADYNILSKADNPVLDVFEAHWKAARVTCILHGSDLRRMPDLSPTPHQGFNVGYIGTVNFVKMHPEYVAMSHQIEIPDVRFVICGSVSEPALIDEVKRLDAAHKFQFKGYLERLDEVISTMDVFGYPLRPDTYASTELVLQEVMFAGVPPVVFPYGGVTQTVRHEVNGLVVHSKKAYVEAVEYLYHHPEERRRLGEAASRYVIENLGIDHTYAQYADVYRTLMMAPKRSHKWGMDASVAPHVWENTKPITEAEMFFASLGPDAGRDFRVSFSHDGAEAILHAERRIMEGSYLVAKSGILPYRNLYPHDPYLNLWAGLCSEGLRDDQAAMICYSTALNQGLRHWRIYWYLARVLERVGERQKAATLFAQLQPYRALVEGVYCLMSEKNTPHHPLPELSQS